MSYGFAVYTAGGAVRVFDGSWLFKYHSVHTIIAPASGSTTRNISGFDPSIWGVYAVSVTTSEGDNAGFFRVSLALGQITVYGYFTLDVTYKLYIFKA